MGIHQKETAYPPKSKFRRDDHCPAFFSVWREALPYITRMHTNVRFVFLTAGMFVSIEFSRTTDRLVFDLWVKCQPCLSRVCS